MSQDVVINGTTYPGVESISLQDSEGNARMYFTNAVRYVPQTLTNEQKAQARENIGAASADEVSELSKEIADYGTLTLGVHTDGLVYIFVNGSPVGSGVDMQTSAPISGYIDSENNLILKENTPGALPDGEYTAGLVMEDGSIVTIGQLVKDTNVYYSVTNNLTNCVNSNSATKAVHGESYAATITANDGYELKSVSVTMGGEAVSASGGSISIASVTGDIVITAVAEEQAVEVEPTNFAAYNTSNTMDWNSWINLARIGSDGAYRSDTESADYGTPAVSPWIEIKTGDIVKYTGFYTSAKVTGLYKADKTIVRCAALPSLSGVTITEACSANTYAGQFTITDANAGYLRLGGYVKGNKGTPVINVQRNGEWL